MAQISPPLPDIKQRKEQSLAQGEQKTIQLREWKGMNTTATRPGIEDTEFAWLENMIAIGPANAKIVPGVGPTISGGALPATISTIWGFTLNGVSVLLVVGVNGAIAQVNTATNAITAVAGAGTVTTACRMAIWQSSPILIIDPTKGYFSWDGTTFTTISAIRLGSALAAFEGRVWIVTPNSRTITFTSPNTFNDFTPANGSGSVTISDSVFVGNITNVLSALEQLWIVGPGAVDAITNVQTAGTPLVTTFSLTNIVSNVGTTLPTSLSTFFRTILFQTPYGVWAIVGSTPQKLSAKLDGLFPKLTLGSDAPAAVGTAHNVFIWATLATFNDPGTIPGSTPGPRQILLCFADGKWFIGAAGAITWITGVVSAAGVPQIWATTGSGVFPLFADVTVAVPYVVQTKLFDMGALTTLDQLLRVAMELSSDSVITAPTLTVENQHAAQQASITIQPTNTVIFVGSGPITFVGAGPITWVTAGLQIGHTANLSLAGNYLGLTIRGSQPSFTLSALAMETRRAGPWNFN